MQTRNLLTIAIEQIYVIDTDFCVFEVQTNLSSRIKQSCR